VIDLNYFLLYKTLLVTHLVRSFFLSLIFDKLEWSRHTWQDFVLFFWLDSWQCFNGFIFQVCQRKCGESYINGVKEFVTFLLFNEELDSLFFCSAITSLKSSGEAVLSSWTSTATSEKTFFFS